MAAAQTEMLSGPNWRRRSAGTGSTSRTCRLLRRLAGPAYGFPGPQPGYYALLQTDDGVAAVAETFRYLLYGPGDVADRLDDCIQRRAQATRRR